MSWWQTKKTVQPLAFSYYFFTIVLISLLGLGDAIYLAVSHYRLHTDIGYQSLCAISRALNCDTVAQSPYAILFGVPVSVWGIWGYGFFLGLLAFARPKKASNRRMWTILFFMALGFSLFSLFLAIVSTYWIHSYCIVCIFSYAVNLMLLYFSWLVHNRFGCESIFKSIRLDVRYLSTYPKSLGTILSFFGIGAVLMILFFPSYWQTIPIEISSEISRGVTEDGHPWIGAEKPELVIEEFSDYMCLQCKKMHFFLRRMIQAYPEKIRLIHRHFPMDHTFNPVVKEPFHIGSARLALIAIYFAEQGKFWEINDVLFNISRETESITIRDLAKQAGLSLEDVKPVAQESALWKKLQQDIEAGIEYQLSGTPGFIIDGKVYTGQIPASIFHSHGIFETKK